jgi:Insertion element 4 transposase N-terminal
MSDNGVVAGGRLTDQITLGVLASAVPRDAVDDAVDSAGRQARRRDGKLPPHVMVYFTMAMALFADDDYEEIAARLAGALASWGCWDDSWSVPTSGGITQARQRLGFEPLAGLFAAVAQPVAGPLTRGAFLAGWRLMSIDGFEWDAPDTKENAAAFGYAGKDPADPDRPALPKVRVVTVSECGSHAVVDAEIGGVSGKGAGEQSLARKLYRWLADDWLLIADRNFYNWQDWCAAADTGAALLWRVKADLSLPAIDILPDGSYLSVLVSPQIKGKARQQVIAAARAGEDLDEDKARYVRVVEYQVPDRGRRRQGRADRPDHHDHRARRRAGAAAGAGLPRKMGARDEQATVLSYLWLVGIAVRSFPSCGGDCLLVAQPGPPKVLSAWHLVERPQTLDFGGVCPHHGPLDGRVQVSGGPAAADPGVEGDRGHGQVVGQVAQPPFVLVQERALSGDAGTPDACRAQQVTDGVGGEGGAAFGWAEALGVEMAGDLR